MLNGKNKSVKAFVWLSLGAFGTTLSVFFRNYIIYSQYDEPPPLLFLPLLFEYAAFSLIAFLFPWSWRIMSKNWKLRAISVITTCLLFVIVYVFALNSLEWHSHGRTYNFWRSFQFTALHSSLLSMVIYTIISFVLYRIGIADQSEPISKDWLTRIPYRLQNETFFIELDQVQYFESYGNYISIYTDTSQRHLIRKTISGLEHELDPKKFSRIHRRRMVNVEKIISFSGNPNGGYKIFLKDKKLLKVSRSYSEKIRPLLRNL